MKKLIPYITFVFICLFLGCKNESKKTEPVAEPYKLQQTVYYGGDILTMEGEAPQYAEALVEENGKIIFVGALNEANKKYANALKHNLKEGTLLPAFIDSHGHCLSVGIMKQVANLLPPPDGPGANVETVVNTLNRWKDSAEGQSFIKKTGLIFGNGYDDSQLQEKDHPKATDLDKVSTEHPVIIMHQSGHLGVANTKALEIMGYVGQVENPKEGVLRRNANGTPNGVMEENAFFQALFKFLKTDASIYSKAVDLFLEEYAANGYLTVQDGRTAPEQVKVLSQAADSSRFYLDVVAYPDMRMSDESLNSDYYSTSHTYKNNFRIGGVKLTLDGSPQGKTAWLTQHYQKPPEGKPTDYKGYPIMTDEKANSYISNAFKNKWQIICHTNGDAAIDQFLNAVENAQKEHAYNDHRTTIIHGQTIRKDQIERAAKLGVYASLFPMHTFYWGDWHVESVLGHPRADYISPMVDAKMAGLNITSHHDAPVTFPNSMRVLDATVNRVTRSGYVLGPNQRLSAFDGLKTLTIWAAQQYFEEATKGSLSIGKNADFVILDKNPVKINPMNIHTIKILESIKNGQSVYKR